MLKVSNKIFDEIINALPHEAKVLDVGAASAPTLRADAIIDIVPYENIVWDKAKGPGPRRLSSEAGYARLDICERQPWPFVDKHFDYSICSHVLEDIRDPIWVASELSRISKAGYIEVPSRFYEQTFGIEAKGLAGASHHRWLVDVHEDRLRFTFKYFYVHSSIVNRGYSGPGERFLRIEWSDSFGVFENWLNSGKEIFEYFLEREISEKEKWKIYRKLQNQHTFIKWLAYLKNTNKTFAKLFGRFRP